MLFLHLSIKIYFNNVFKWPTEICSQLTVAWLDHFKVKTNL